MSKVKLRRALLRSTALAGMLWSGGVLAQTQTYAFDIPSESLRHALQDVARISGQQIIFSDSLTAGRNASALHGTFTADEALRRLLEGTDLVVVHAASGGIMVKSKNAQAAQDLGSPSTDQSNGATEEVTVTGTRIVRQGFVAPTPVTTMTSQDLQLAGYTQIGDALKDMPLDTGDNSPTTTGVHAFNTADLRGLGSARTLTLVDGERPVWTDPRAGFSLSAIPISIVKRIDIVTGGASAAWGSDAVSGVVNIVIDNDFVGLRGGFQYGKDWQGYGANEMASLAVGTHFGPDDRGHFMVAAQWTNNDLIPSSDVPLTYGGLIQNPNFNPALPTSNGGSNPEALLVSNLDYSNKTLGGIITGCSKSPCPLKGIAFATTGGAPYAFQYGADYIGGSTMSGGGVGAIPEQYGSALEAADTHYNLYSQASYDVSSDITLTADFLYSNYNTLSHGGIEDGASNFTISNTNAYLPASIANEMAADGITSFTLGRGNADIDGGVGGETVTLSTQSYWGSLGAKGSFGDNWTWNIFYNYGVTDSLENWGPEPIRANLNAAVNSVINPATGLAECAPGSPAGCVPIDLFGNGSPSAAALAYVTGIAKDQFDLDQNEAGGELQGEPFSTWAGPVSVAGGMEWRTEAVKQTVDALSAAKAFSVESFAPLSGHYSVTEGFAETVVPLLSNMPAAEEFDFNGAVRESGYSTSGDITSWKLGATDKATDELLVRGTVSRDIRAPNVSELFSPQRLTPNTIIDPANHDASYAVESYSGGNPNLMPEIADTVTYGGVYTPSWFPNFDLSVDWWTIDIHNVISNISVNSTITDCYAGDALACANVIRSAPSVAYPAGQILYVNNYNSNLNKEEASGLDIEASHHLTLSDIWDTLPGSLTSHLLLTYVDKTTTVNGTIVQSDVATTGSAGDALRWRSVLTETYDWDRFEAYVRFRYLSGENLEVYPSTITVNENHIDGQYYFDIGASYYLSDDRKYQVYVNVVNVADQTAPAYQATFYDPFGRMYNFGFRIAM